ncbi:MAG: CPBP family intramembrane glutamic endopeptidase [Pseudomonadota bacterium]
MDGIISITGILALMLCVGTLIGIADRKNFSFAWLIIAAGVVLLNDVLLTNAYGLFPKLVPNAEWNWQGKLLALLGTLAVASLPAFGRRRSGLTLKQADGSLRACVPLVLAYCLFFIAIALAFPNDDASAETIAFHLTLPSIEEEPFYRGILLLALYETYAGRVRMFGVEWGWGAIFSCLLFGFAHAFNYSGGSFAFDPIYMGLTAIPSFLAVWMRLKTGSLLLPVLMHSAGNSIPLFL